MRSRLPNGLLHPRPRDATEDGRRYSLAVLPSLVPEPFVSVVIPALNEEQAIGCCLASFVLQTYPAQRMELIVADGGSSDRTRDIVTAFASSAPFAVRLVDNPARTTPAGLNAGIAAATGDVIMIFGAHALAGPRAVAATVSALQRTGAAAAGVPIATRGKGPVSRAIAAALSHPFGVGDARFRFATSSRFVDTIAFAGYRRECFEVLGGFDLNREKAEDDFFNHRVRQAGGRLYLDASANNVYFARTSFRGVAGQYFGYGRARALAGVREPASLRPRHIVPFTAVVAALVVALAAPWWSAARAMLAISAPLYALACVVSAFKATGGQRSASLVPLTALSFGIVHASYGIGTLKGLFDVLAAPIVRQRSS